MQDLFREALTQSADYGRLEQKIRDGVTPVSVFGVCDGQKTHLAAALTEDRPLLVITHSLASAEIIRQDYEFYTGAHMTLFPAREQNLQAAFQTGDWVRRRMEALQELLGDTRAAVAPLEAVLYTIPPREVTQEARMALTPGMRMDIRSLKEQLLLCGYSAVSSVQGKGEFCVHGGLVDLFPDEGEQPLRLDFFDDELEAIRLVDPVSQRTIGTRERAVILPRRELCVSPEACVRAGESLREELLRFNRTCRSREAVTSATDTFIPMAEKLKNGVLPTDADHLIAYFFPQYTSLLDYMPADTLVVFDEIKLLRERAKNAEEEFSRVLTSLIEEGRALLKHGQMFTGFDRLLLRAQKQQIVTMQSISGALEGLESRAVFRFEGRVMQSFHGKPEFLTQEVRALQNSGYRTVLCAGTQARAERLEKELIEAGIAARRFRRADQTISEGEVAITEGSVAKGYEYPRLRFAVIAEHDLFSFAKHTARAPLKRKNGLESFADLKTGDFVVHETNGIARDMGIVKIETDGVKRDYLFLQFRNDDRCYVPVEQMNRVQKYIAPDEGTPQLSRLGTQEWNRTKARVKKSIADLTEKLLSLYRARENTPGIPFDPDTPWQRAFEEDFPYEETPDQVKCVREIKADMESPRAMDRLLCGDVGYGKTEVALRAIFKAVMRGKQAALLAPTTILVQQHYAT
ncbi:MAG: hypothetical protein J6X30_01720, partial [Clostridia bacterium]|nr:hypothetical protein [Clostridia bacterium]